MKRTSVEYKDLALITAIILKEDILNDSSFYHQTLFEMFDKAYSIAEKFQDIYPHDFNWEGEDLDFDEAIILFTKQQD